MAGNSSMIPATHFRDNGDDTAWWVLTASDTIDPATGENYIDTLDRPCGVCGGNGFTSNEMLRDAPCPDCIDGRHTFDVVVQTCERYDCPACIGDGPGSHDRFRTNQVSIIPGMVLPIYGGCPDYEPADHICQCYDDQWTHHSSDGPYTEEQVTLPSAAAPGMWAVKLRVG